MISKYTQSKEKICQKGVFLVKKITKNGQTFEIALEGEDKVLYMTHDFTSLVACDFPKF